MPGKLSQQIKKGDFITDEKSLFEVISCHDLVSCRNVHDLRYETFTAQELDDQAEGVKHWRRVIPEPQPDSLTA